MASDAADAADETGRVIRRLWLHIKALYVLLISVSLASVVVFLLCFGELQRLQATGHKGRRQQRMLSEEIMARFDPETLTPLNASVGAATDSDPAYAEDDEEEEEDGLLENSSSSFPDASLPTTLPPQRNEDRHRRRSNLRRHLKDKEEGDDSPQNLPPPPPPLLPPTKEDRRNLPTSGDAAEETDGGRDKWIWLTSYSRIPVGLCSIHMIHTPVINSGLRAQLLLSSAMLSVLASHSSRLSSGS